MILALDNRRVPSIAPDAWIAPGAVVVGDVTIGAESSIWYNAVLRGDNTSIVVGSRTNIQDGCVVHADEGSPAILGNSVTVGHNTTLHGCTIADNTLVGMGSTIMNGADIGADCIIGAGTLVPQGMSVPDRSLVVGAPAKISRTLSDDEFEHLAGSADDYVANSVIHREACRD
ncbi:gamma carbonic anhydrase family protein [Rhodococcus fascians]|nr:gamma carbonic anhydrase family protein [Rhodococcus fascians]MBY3997808.1 gamma carbonic anhydrase family protein [Rhodococcus fascians]MBY4002809.1 gamma carbonic anhydrase family protein [Rhodococcus fascians]MBY4006800.1 gamma carbonic anhydrase family protein [Rhodococcus fascians]MBY4019407.1 gamma carbonic anhydrase family protein [Rhodococcus fascians]